MKEIDEIEEIEEVEEIKTTENYIPESELSESKKNHEGENNVHNQ